LVHKSTQGRTWADVAAAATTPAEKALALADATV